VFVKSGTILPILNFEIDRMSILQAIEDPIRLEIFPDSADKSTGQLYLDDGLTNDYQSGSYAQYEFTYADNVLSVTTVVSADASAMWAQTSNKMISEVVI
jgi:alpha-glucosidase (family GH31 glycosyl hydrolase)